ncbi:Imm32 family immunity protein [Streptomyces murinus]|uniref:Imm32 family immunity protein n=1 Tax=Streptomyces murinus TaxID=33900 RepID=UPI002113DDCB|nr:hypothetical protein [Streptomyces murinus]
MILKVLSDDATGELGLSGNRSELLTLGRRLRSAQGGIPLNIKSFASEAEQGDHLHVEHFPAHDYLAEGSESLVVATDSGAVRVS